MGDRPFDSSSASGSSRTESRSDALRVAPTTAEGRALARKVLETEAAAILALVDRLDDRFDTAVQLLRQCKGRVILTGMGKSGIICRKIAATLTSTGTASFFLHPADAIHGDLGAIQSGDVVIALSNGGETAELIHLLETIRRLGARLIAITGSPASSLAQAADVALDCSVAEEACPMNLVPTASTTAALALGDALAMTLLVEKGFRQEDFAHLHPGGKLGKRLMRAETLMHAGRQCPVVRADTRMRDVIYEMSSKGLGMTCVIDADETLLGIITDGDLRRRMEHGGEILGLSAIDVMTRHPVSVSRHTLAAEALNIMEQRKITSIVVAESGQPIRVAGVLHLHDLWDGTV
jgi:arabinose-5-phosphate isomerase